MRRIAALVLVLALCAGLLPGCTGGAKKESVAGFYFDTVVTIIAYGAKPAVLDDALALCGRYEALLSRTRKGSDVFRVNRAQGQRTAVSEETRAVLEKAIRYGDLSGGKFDVTIAPASALWDFHGETPKRPEKAALSAAMELVDYRTIDINDQGVQLPAGCQIDLGGIAKGYIADRVAEFLRQQGVEHAFLNFGGNVLTIGTKPDGSPWSVGIQDPKSETGAAIAAVSSADSSVVTSGIYQRGFTVDGTYYHHILDPETGYPCENTLASVTILTGPSADGDALSTAVFALGETRGMALVEELPDVEAVMITREGEIIASSGATLFTAP